MALYLVQHGQSHSKDTDPAQGLTEEGRATVTRIASVAKGYNVPVACILHSGKKRARETAEIIAGGDRPNVERLSALRETEAVTLSFFR